MTSIEFLNNLSSQIFTQDNEYTSIPIFTVKELVTHIGIDTEYATEVEVVWINDGEIVGEDDTEEMTPTKLESMYNNGEDIPDGFYRTGIGYQSVIREVFLTRRAAEAYIKKQAHRHSGTLSLSVESAHRNPELREIRRLLSGPIQEGIASLQRMVEVAERPHGMSEESHRKSVFDVVMRSKAAIAAMNTDILGGKNEG